MQVLEFTKDGVPFPDLTTLAHEAGLDGIPSGDRSGPEAGEWQELLDGEAMRRGQECWEDMSSQAWHFSPQQMTLERQYPEFLLRVDLQPLIEGEISLEEPIGALLVADCDKMGIGPELRMVLRNTAFRDTIGDEDRWWLGTAIASMDFVAIGQAFITVISMVLEASREAISMITGSDDALLAGDIPGHDLHRDEMESFNAILEEMLRS